MAACQHTASFLLVGVKKNVRIYTIISSFLLSFFFAISKYKSNYMTAMFTDCGLGLQARSHHVIVSIVTRSWRGQSGCLLYLIRVLLNILWFWIKIHLYRSLRLKWLMCTSVVNIYQIVIYMSNRLWFGTYSRAAGAYWQPPLTRFCTWLYRLHISYSEPTFHKAHLSLSWTTCLYFIMFYCCLILKTQKHPGTPT